MSLKDALTNSLLMFVAATCVVLIVKALPQTPPPPQAVAGTSGETAARQPQRAIRTPTLAVQDGVKVYYLHGNTRCPTCRTIEAYAQEAVQTGFADELKSGKIDWQVINYESPGNEHYATDYEVVAPNVVLAMFKDGKQVKWKGLPEVWEHVGDKAAFTAFVQTSLREFLASDASPEPNPVHAPASLPNARYGLSSTADPAFNPPDPGVNSHASVAVETLIVLRSPRRCWKPSIVLLLLVSMGPPGCQKASDPASQTSGEPSGRANASTPACGRAASPLGPGRGQVHPLQDDGPDPGGTEGGIRRLDWRSCSSTCGKTRTPGRSTASSRFPLRYSSTPRARSSSGTRVSSPKRISWPSGRNWESTSRKKTPNRGKLA